MNHSTPSGPDECKNSCTSDPTCDVYCHDNVFSRCLTSSDDFYYPIGTDCYKKA